MSDKNRYIPRTPSHTQAVPFDNAEEAWFWFIAAQQARLDGAKFIAGQALVPRPCEPLDILKILDRLYRNRRLLRDHLLVLRHYGRRYMAPDPGRVKEARAAVLWAQALERMGEVMMRKNIVRKQNPHEDWVNEAVVLGTSYAPHQGYYEGETLQ